MTGHPLADVEALAAVIDGMHARTPRARRLLVGIAGAPGAGKSTVAARLAAALPASVVLPMDGFHLPQARLVALGRRDRMGAPDTFDVAAFIALLSALRRDDGGTVPAPDFDSAIEEPVPAAIAIGPDARTVIVEGNYLLHEADGWQPVAGLLDVTVALRLDDPTRRARLVARHVAHGKTPTEAEAWVAGPDEANARLIAAGLDRADYSLSG